LSHSFIILYKYVLAESDCSDNSFLHVLTSHITARMYIHIASIVNGSDLEIEYRVTFVFLLLSVLHTFVGLPL